jgi:hypothetical protein
LRLKSKKIFLDIDEKRINLRGVKIGGIFWIALFLSHGEKIMAKTNYQSIIMHLPLQPKLKYTFTFEGELNITPYVAKQKANYFLVMQVGNLVMAAEPNLEFHEQGAWWRVPAMLTNPEQGHIGKIGEIIVDAQTGSIIEDETTPIEEMQINADSLAEEAAL